MMAKIPTKKRASEPPKINEARGGDAAERDGA